jgi:hypothetical protein
LAWAEVEVLAKETNSITSSYGKEFTKSKGSETGMQSL